MKKKTKEIKEKDFNLIIINPLSYTNELDKVTKAINNKKYDEALKLLERIIKSLMVRKPCLVQGQWVS